MSLLKGTLSVFRRITVVIAIALAFLFGLATTVYLSLRSPEVRVPNVVGKDRFEAENALGNAGLNSRVRATRPSSEVKPDIVLFQLPRAGEVVKAGQTVAMDISRATKEGESSEVVSQDTKAVEEKQSENITSSATNGSENKQKRNKNTNKNANTNDNIGGATTTNTNRTANANRTAASENVNVNTGATRDRSAATNSNLNRNGGNGNVNSRANTNEVGNKRPVAKPSPSIPR